MFACLLPPRLLACYPWQMLTRISFCLSYREALVPAYLVANENPSAVGGSGGEIGAWISYDDASNILSLNVGWGSGNGFVDLTGPVTVSHIHNAGSADFSQNGGVEITLHTLGGFNTSATNGGFTGNVTLTEAQEVELLDGLVLLKCSPRLRTPLVKYEVISSLFQNQVRHFC